jgi:hypothetical protein
LIHSGCGASAATPASPEKYEKRRQLNKGGVPIKIVFVDGSLRADHSKYFPLNFFDNISSDSAGAVEDVLEIRKMSDV